MSNKQITFNELLEPKKSTSKKDRVKTGNTKSKETSKTTKSNDKTKKTSTDKIPKRVTLGSKTRVDVVKKLTEEKTKAVNKTKPRNKNKTGRVTFTQDELDKLCEVYDWYMTIKDLDPIKQVKQIENTDIKIEEDIIKEAKKVSITIDQEVWENFSTLATNISQKKGPLLTEILKEYLQKHKDLY